MADRTNVRLQSTASMRAAVRGVLVSVVALFAATVVLFVVPTQAPGFIDTLIVAKSLQRAVNISAALQAPQLSLDGLGNSTVAHKLHDRLARDLACWTQGGSWVYDANREASSSANNPFLEPYRWVPSGNCRRPLQEFNRSNFCALLSGRALQ